MNFKPMGDRVLISPINESISGKIILTDTEDLGQKKGTVVALPENKEDSLGVKVGDTVLFENVGVDMTLEGKDYKLIHIEYIQGILS